MAFWLQVPRGSCRTELMHFELKPLKPTPTLERKLRLSSLLLLLESKRAHPCPSQMRQSLAIAAPYPWLFSANGEWSTAFMRLCAACVHGTQRALTYYQTSEGSEAMTTTYHYHRCNCCLFAIGEAQLSPRNEFVRHLFWVY